MWKTLRILFDAMNRIDELFIKLRSKKKSAFISFITAGDPDIETTRKLILEFEQNGVDLIEIGVPFSDPLADGPIIQASSQRALKINTNIKSIFSLVKKLRRSTQIPVALMTYYNPIFHYREDRFIKEAVECGVDGLIVPDLPPEEAKTFIREARKNNLATIFLIAPTTTEKRMKLIAGASTGFIYYVSLTGVTGVRDSFSSSIQQKLEMVRKYTRMPVCVGFGVSTRQQVQLLSKYADGVIVGSAIVKEIEDNIGHKNMVNNVVKFVKHLAN